MFKNLDFSIKSLKNYYLRMLYNFEKLHYNMLQKYANTCLIMIKSTINRRFSDLEIYVNLRLYFLHVSFFAFVLISIMNSNIELQLLLMFL